MDAQAPPSYQEATDSSNEYITSRPPPPPPPSSQDASNASASSPDTPLTYHLAMDPFRSVPLPSPEEQWTSREVTYQDWNVFMAQVEEAKGNQRVVDEWNAKFFSPRGCRVTTARAPSSSSSSSLPTTTTTTTASKENPGLGVSCGNWFLGAGVCKSSDYVVGIRIGGFMIGGMEKPSKEKAADPKVVS